MVGLFLCVGGLQAVNYQLVQLDFVNETLADAGRLRSVDASRILLRDLKSMQEVLAKLLKNKVRVAAHHGAVRHTVAWPLGTLTWTWMVRRTTARRSSERQ